QQAERYARLLRAVGEGAAASSTPVVVVSNLAVDFHPAFAAAAREAGAPCLRGTAEGLYAVARYARWGTSPPEEAAAPSPPARAPRRGRGSATSMGRAPRQSRPRGAQGASHRSLVQHRRAPRAIRTRSRRSGDGGPRLWLSRRAESHARRRRAQDRARSRARG